jgi:predicted nucleotidyltransferase
MISNERIQQASRILIDAAHPERIILFGSYARGDASEDSDLDLLVIERSLPNKRAEMVRLRELLRPLRIPVDIIVVSQREFSDWSHLPGTAFYWAAKEGRVLHEAAA